MAERTESPPATTESGKSGQAHRGGALVLAALGVVFGDIGTSPLYALQTVFSLDHGRVQPTPDDVFGVISMVFWSVTLIVSVKYVGILMRLDNHGEGGVMALATLARRAIGTDRRRSSVVLVLAALGASLFYGDSVITPAISVLSAVEGLDVAAPSLRDLVVPIAVTIVTLLFVVQRWGTSRIGTLFGPVMGLWFAALAIAGLREALIRPEIFDALAKRPCTPTWATSAARRSDGPGSSSRSRHSPSTTSARAR